ncbi:MAG: phosphate/phosphite/phosphonate ABC transporter substrate-binding protein [Campylobacterales bacterium]|nr:phosphate/phosphite/phosphonate ABC transporter substrate-binding protein [Campylobacterales bacterium]
MNKSVFLFLLLLSHLISSEKVLALGVSPWIEKQQLIEAGKPFVNHLEKKLNMKIDFHIGKDYGDTINKIKFKKFDIAIIGTSAYIEIKKIIPTIKYIATVQNRGKNGGLKSNYRSFIVVKKDSGYRTLDDLKGKKFAFTDFKSNGGYIYPSYYLKKKGITPKKYFSKVYMLKKHTKVAEAIGKGAIDGGAIYDKAYYIVNERLKGSLKVLEQVAVIPNELVVLAPHIEKKLQKKIEKAILSYRYESINNNEYVIANRFIKLKKSAYNNVIKIKRTLSQKDEI